MYLFLRQSRAYYLFRIEARYCENFARSSRTLHQRSSSPSHQRILSAPSRARPPVTWHAGDISAWAQAYRTPAGVRVEMWTELMYELRLSSLPRENRPARRPFSRRMRLRSVMMVRQLSMLTSVE